MEKVLKLLNRLTDFHHIWRESIIGDVFFEKLVKYNILTKSKMAATTILETYKVL